MSVINNAPYTLANAEQMALKNPDSFIIDCRKRRENLAVGRTVKLAFLHPKGSGERMWVETFMKDMDTGRYTGRLVNIPTLFDNHALKYQDNVTFGPEHIYEIYEGMQ